jgi:hypothetical protein
MPASTLGQSSVTVIWHRPDDFSLPGARHKVLDKEVVADVQFIDSSLPSVTLGKAFVERYRGFAECLRHSTKNSVPVV